jgi:hypothetical protein
MDKEAYQFVESFVDFYGASSWIEGHLRDIEESDMHVYNCSVNYINGMFRAGITFGKRQGELFNEI